MAIVIDLVLNSRAVKSDLLQLTDLTQRFQAQLKAIGAGPRVPSLPVRAGIAGASRSNLPASITPAMILAAKRMGLSVTALHKLLVDQQAQRIQRRIRNAIGTPQSPQQAFLKSVQQAIFSSRMNLGPISPLIGKFGQMGKAVGAYLETLGVGTEALAAFSVVAGVAVAIIGALAYAFKKAQERIESFATIENLTGSKPGKETALVDLLARTMDKNATEMSAVIGDFVQQISKGGLNEGLFSQKGIRARKDAIGMTTQDQAALYIQALKTLRGVDDRTAAMMTRGPHHEEMMQFREMSPQVFKEFLDSVSSLGEVTAKDKTKLADYNAEIGMLSAQWSKLMSAIGAPLVGFVTKNFTMLNGAMKFLAEHGQQIATLFVPLYQDIMVIAGLIEKVREGSGIWRVLKEAFITVRDIISGIVGKVREFFQANKWIGQTWKAITGFFTGLGNAIAQWVHNILNWVRGLIGLAPLPESPVKLDVTKGDKNDPGANAGVAVNANTKALADNTASNKDLARTLKGNREIYGGGKRTAGAIPAAWRYNWSTDNGFAERIRLGAF